MDINQKIKHPSLKSEISHELRTPITKILGMVYLLLDDTILNQEQKKYLEVIQESAYGLLELENLLYSLIGNKTTE